MRSSSIIILLLHHTSFNFRSKRKLDTFLWGHLAQIPYETAFYKNISISTNASTAIKAKSLIHTWLPSFKILWLESWPQFLLSSTMIDGETIRILTKSMNLLLMSCQWNEQIKWHRKRRIRRGPDEMIANGLWIYAYQNQHFSLFSCSWMRQPI